VTFGLAVALGLKEGDVEKAMGGFRKLGLSAEDARKQIDAMGTNTTESGKAMDRALLQASASAGKLAAAVAAGSTTADKSLSASTRAVEILQAAILKVQATGGPVDPAALANLERFRKANEDSARALGTNKAALETARRATDDATRAAGGMGRGINSVADLAGLVSPRLETMALKAGLVYGAFLVVGRISDTVSNGVASIGRSMGVAEPNIERFQGYLALITKLDFSQVVRDLKRVADTAADAVIGVSDIKVSQFAKNVLADNSPARAANEALKREQKELEAETTRLIDRQAALQRQGRLTGDATKALAQSAAELSDRYKAQGLAIPAVVAGLTAQADIHKRLAEMVKRSAEEQERLNAADAKRTAEKRLAAELALTKALKASYAGLMDVRTKAAPIDVTILDLQQRASDLVQQTTDDLREQGQQLRALEIAHANVVETMGAGSVEAGVLADALERAKAAVEGIGKVDLKLSTPITDQQAGPVAGLKAWRDDALKEVKESFKTIAKDVRATQADIKKAEIAKGKEIAAIHRAYWEEIVGLWANAVNTVASILTEMGAFDGRDVPSGLPSGSVDNRAAGRGQIASNLAGAMQGNPMAWYKMFEGLAIAMTTRGGFHGAVNVGADGVGGTNTSFFNQAGSKEMLDHLKGVGATITGAISSLLETIDGEIAALDIRFTQKGQGWRVQIGDGFSRWFTDLEEAVNYAILEGVRGATITGISPEVTAALEHSTAKTFEQLFADLEFAKWVEDLGLEPVAAQIEMTVEEFARAMQRAVTLGIDTQKIVSAFAQDFQSQRDQLRGIKVDPAEKQRRDMEAFNRQVVLTRLEEQARQATLVAKRAQLEIDIALLRAEMGIGKARIDGRRAMLDAEGRIVGAEMEILQGLLKTLEATDAALAAVGAILGNLPALFTDEDIKKALAGLRGSGGGNRKQNRIDLTDQGRRFGLGNIGTQIDDALAATKRYIDEVKKAGFSTDDVAKLIAAANKNLQQQLAEIRRSVMGRVDDFVGKGGPLGSSLRGIRATAQDLLKDTRELYKAGQISKDTFFRLREEIQRAARAQQEGLVTSATNDLLGELYNLTGETVKSAQLEFDLTVAGLDIKRQELEIAMLELQYSQERMDAILGPIDELIGRVRAAGPAGLGGSGGSGGNDPAASRFASWWQAQLDQQEKLTDAAKGLLDWQRELATSGMSPLLSQIAQITQRFEDLAAVLGRTPQLLDTYHLAIQRAIDAALDPIRQLQRTLLGGEQSPLDAMQKWALSQSEFAAAKSAFDKGDLSIIDKLPQIIEDYIAALQAVAPQGSTGYRTGFTEANDLLNRVLALGGAGSTAFLGTAAPTNFGGAGGQAPAQEFKQAFEAKSDLQLVELRLIKGYSQRTADVLERAERRGTLLGVA
jgi:hypothetical protein